MFQFILSNLASILQGNRFFWHKFLFVRYSTLAFHMKEFPNTGLRILLVEDDSDDIQSFTEAIQKLELQGDVTVVRSCDQLFSQLANDNNFDVIFLDINIPLLDGHQCLKKIKAIRLTKSIEST